MKLKDLGDLIIFDAFPLAFDPNQKIILTHLLHLEEQTMPLKLSTIYTSCKLAEQLKLYCKTRNYKCINESNIFIIEPYTFIDIVLEKRRTLQILFCSSDDKDSRNLMVLIRENGKLNYLYAGNFVDIRSALLNDTFASWITHGVDKLYINLKRTDEQHTFNDIDQMVKIFNIIEEIMNCHKDSQIHLYLPLFGYENFIYKLANEFRNRVAKNSTFKTWFDFLRNDSDPEATKHFRSDNFGKIILFSGISTPHFAKINFDKYKIVTINIVNERSKCMENIVDFNNYYYELFYSPEPSPFHMKLLCMLVKPNRIYGILDTFNNKSKVPQYLIELCVGGKDKIQKKQQRKLDESLRASTGTQLNEPPKTIFVGSTSSKINHKNGPFLSDSDSDDA